MAQSKLQTTWNLTPLFKSDNDPRIAKNRKEVELAVQKFVRKWQKRTDYLTDPKALKTVLDDYENLMHFYGTDGEVWYYFYLKNHLNEADPLIKAKLNKIEDFKLKNINLLQFFELSLTKIDPKLQPKFANDSLLKDYKHFLEKHFAKSAHVLSEAEEKILNLKSVPANMNWTRMTSSFLNQEEAEVLGEDGKKGKRSFNEVMGLVSSQKKRVRDDAAKALNQILDKHAAVAAEEMNSIMADKKIDDELKHFQRPDSSRLLGDDIEEVVVDTLLKAVDDRNDLAISYYKLKAKLFGVKKLEFHERNVDYGTVNLEYTFGQAQKLVSKVFTKLDPEFEEIFQKFLTNGYIDVYPKKGKHGGAFNVHYLLTQPSYVLLNFDQRLNNVMTLAHEFGHAINAELMRKKQNALNFDVPTSTAEVASVFMEDFVLEEVLKSANDEQRLTILMNKLNEEISTVFRQTAFYRFEQDLHQEFRKKGYLPKEDIGKIFQKHMAVYMGPGVKMSAGSQNWWVYIPHFRYYFYVYAYVKGLLVGKGLQSLVRKDPKNIEGVKQFLSTGVSKSPKQIFADLGIDITKKAFWDQGLAEIEETLKETEKLAKKLGKI